MTDQKRVDVRHVVGGDDETAVPRQVFRALPVARRDNHQKRPEKHAQEMKNSRQRSSLHSFEPTIFGPVRSQLGKRRARVPVPITLLGCGFDGGTSGLIERYLVSMRECEGVIRVS